MIRVVFVRHGKKAAMAGRPDHDAPLGEGEPERLALMADAIDAKTRRPELWWSSHFDHCWQTARHLNRGANPVYRLSGLTPYSAEDGFTVQCMVTEASKLGAPMATVSSSTDGAWPQDDTHSNSSSRDSVVGRPSNDNHRCASKS